MSTKSADAKAKWMRETSALIELARPSEAGKIKWDDLAHLYNIGKTPVQASVQYLSS